MKSKEYKGDLLKEKNLMDKLERHGFDINKFWNQQPAESAFFEFENEAKRIKK